MDGAIIAYDRAGSGRPLVFLHGVGSIRQTWTGQLDRFAAAYTAVALDFRGHGESRAPPETITIERFTADLARLIGHLGGGPAHICGLSLGGVVAMRLWAEHPRLVASLTLADSWAVHPKACEGLPERLAAIDAGTMPELAELRMPTVLGPMAAPTLVRRAVEVMAAKDKAAYRRTFEVLWCTDMREVAARIDVASLVLVGEHDTITPPELSRELASLIRGSRLVVVPGAGHLTNEENPTVFDSSLAAFLQEVDS